MSTQSSIQAIWFTLVLLAVAYTALAQFRGYGKKPLTDRPPAAIYSNRGE